MSPWVIVLIIVVVAAVALLAWWAARRKRTTDLRERFGPEYDRTVRETGDDRRAAIVRPLGRRRVGGVVAFGLQHQRASCICVCVVSSPRSSSANSAR